MNNKIDNNQNSLTAEVTNTEKKEEVIAPMYTNNGKRLVKVPDKYTSYDIPEGTVVICDCAFCGCQSLKNVTIPASVTTIGKQAFNGCIYEA
jgi:hypothetical protein